MCSQPSKRRRSDGRRVALWRDASARGRVRWPLGGRAASARAHGGCLPGDSLSAVGGYTVGVLVQSNFGGVLQIMGFPVGERLGRYYLKEVSEKRTEATADRVRYLHSRSAFTRWFDHDRPRHRRAVVRPQPDAAGATRDGRTGTTGAAMSNGSGDYALAFSTSEVGAPYAAAHEQSGRPDRVRTMRSRRSSSPPSRRPKRRSTTRCSKPKPPPAIAVTRSKPCRSPAGWPLIPDS